MDAWGEHPKMRIQEVFTPFDTPTVTYVDRAEHKLEKTLRSHYDTPNVIVSISGPSKSGKTVLIKKVVPEDELIPVAGAGVTSAENLWERVIHWMGGPVETSTSVSYGVEATASAEASGKLKVPFVAEGQAGGTAGVGTNLTKTSSESRRADGLTSIIREVADSNFVVFIDDFHYITDNIREEVGRQIKAAAENGIKIITASVPHRSDDVVRSNPELRGRVACLDLAYWSPDELQQIAIKGFGALNVSLPKSIEKRLVAEAFGSPQLMQAICLNISYELQVDHALDKLTEFNVSERIVSDALQRTSAFSDFNKMLTAFHTGPRTRGTERKLHEFWDGTKGDVYRAILLAIKNEPAELSLPYDKILARVREVCKAEAPVGSSIVSALEQIQLIGEEVQPATSPISWDGDVFVITDPYFLFYLRHSDKLATLADR